MKILIFNYLEVTTPGGINKAVSEISKNLSKKGHDVTVLQNNYFRLPDQEKYEGFKVVRITSKFADIFYGLSPEMYFFLKKNFKELNPDIVHVHGYHNLFSAEIVYSIRKLDSKVPIVFSPHFDIVRETFAGRYLWDFYKFFSKPIINKSSHFVVFSKFECENVIKSLNVDSYKISIIPHGVDRIDVAKKSKGKKFNLIYFGYLIKRKGIDSILKALKSLVYDLGEKNIVLKIIGEGPELENLLKLSNKLGIDEYVSWESFLNEEKLLQEIKKADLSLLLSNSEAYGITVGECLALGTPCLVTKRAALNEFLNEPGCFGVDYPPNPKEVADLIIKISENDIQVGPFSSRILTWDVVSEDYERLYSSLRKEVKNADK
jgi:glycogen synthase